MVSILLIMHAVLFPSFFSKMKKPILPFYPATSHAQCLQNTEINQDLSATSLVIKTHSGFLDFRKEA